MIFVDSSVWIDYFRGVPTPQTDMLDDVLGVEFVCTGDVVLTEVLQGFAREREFNQALAFFGEMEVLEVGGRGLAVQAARNHRLLRTRGVTVRKTIDTLIATCCIEGGHELLYSDRDFDPFVKHLGLARAGAVRP